MQDSQIVCQLFVNKLTLDPHPRVLQTFTFQIFLSAASTSLGELSRLEEWRYLSKESCSDQVTTLGCEGRGGGVVATQTNANEMQSRRRWCYPHPQSPPGLGKLRRTGRGNLWCRTLLRFSKLSLFWCLHSWPWRMGGRCEVTCDGWVDRGR